MDQTNEEQVCHLAEKYRKMVAKMAWRAWRRLPAHTRIWVSVEDLIQEGMNWVALVGIPKFNQVRAEHLSTFVQHGINNLLFDKCGKVEEFDKCGKVIRYGKGLQARERNEARVVSFGDLTGQFDNRGTIVTMDRLLYRREKIEDVVRDCFVVPLVMNVHRRATKNLRTELVKWFLTANRLKLTTPRFLTAKDEFGKLAKVEGLDINDCRHLMASPTCMEQLARRLQ